MTTRFIALVALFLCLGRTYTSHAASTSSCYSLSAADQAKTQAPGTLCMASDAVDFPAFSLTGTITLSGKTYSALRMLAGEDIYLVSAVVYTDAETEVTAEVYATEDNQISGEPDFVLELKAKKEAIPYKKIPAVPSERGCFKLASSIAQQTGLPAEFCTGAIQFACPYARLEGSVKFSAPKNLAGNAFKSACSLNGEDLYLSQTQILESAIRSGGCDSMEVYKVILEGNVYRENQQDGAVTARIEFWSTGDACHSPLKLQTTNFAVYSAAN